AKEDIVKPSPATELKDEGYNYICIRMARKITITVANKQPRTIKSTKRYIYQLLSDSGVTLNSEDRVFPVPQTPLADGMKIKVTKVKHRVYAEKEVIPYRVIYRDDPTIPEGDEVVAQEGQVGIIKKTRKIYYKNHEVSSENVIKKELLCDPVNKIVLVGTKVEPSYIPPSPPPVALASHGSVKSGSFITMEATAYEPSAKSCGPFASGYTATGLPARYGVVAVDPYVIPLGSHLYVEGYGYAIAADKGTAITGNRIDLCFDTYEDAINYGRRTVKVYLLK
ncbi:MAG: 3D domain-containing protein, partial [Candidatus Eremiobacterota bacterium]